jgi:inosine-uridine nucleoside N-ribohydrolase
MHDPLAVTCITDDVCVFEKKYVKVNLNEELKGALLVSDAPQEGYSLINVATKVNRDRFNALVINRLYKKNNL